MLRLTAVQIDLGLVSNVLFPILDELRNFKVAVYSLSHSRFYSDSILANLNKKQLFSTTFFIEFEMQSFHYIIRKENTRMRNAF